MEPSPANRDITFSPVLLMKDTVSLSTFYQKSQPVDSALHTEYHTCYTTTSVQYFNGKEKDYESGFHYFGARYYWSELLTGWLSVDPMADKYPSLSPYVYCAWNPVKIIDPDGRDTLLFSNNGYYEKTLPGGNNIGIIKGKTGRYGKEFSFADESWCERFVKADDMDLLMMNSSRDRENKLFNRIVVIDEDFIERLLGKSGVNYWFRHGDKRGSEYAKEESRGGQMDFVNYPEIQNVTGALFVTTVNGESMAHDQFNMGNFMWGAAMRRLGVSRSLVWLGSNGDCFLNTFKFDSPDDQRSIWHGYKYTGPVHNQIKRKK